MGTVGMLRKISLLIIFCILGYGFWISPDFKELAAGVAIFLFGMLFLEEGFQAFTGGVLERILAKSTSSLWKAVSVGTVTTSLMQSSTLVTIITISFLSAGLLNLTAGIGIIFGANIGTTTGAWLVAGLGLKVKISAYAMPMLVFGIILILQRSRTLKGIGSILAGLGFLFLGIHYMKEGFEAFRTSIDLASLAMGGFIGVLVYSLLGVVTTVIMQSSNATLVLIITALAAQQLSYENALALAIGANIGTTITALVGAMSSNHQGKRLARAHFIFNLVTGAIAIAFINQFMMGVELVSEFLNIAEDNYTLKLAVFHTLFNLTGVVVMLPFIKCLVRFLEKIVRAKAPNVAEPEFLSEVVLEVPSTTIEAVRKEVLHLYDSALEIVTHGLSFDQRELEKDPDSLEEILTESRAVIELDVDEAYLTKVKALHSAIIEFISRAHPQLDSNQADQLFELRNAAVLIVQCVKDIKHLHKNMSRYIPSDNEHIRSNYNKLRVTIALVLQQLHAMKQGTSDTGDVLIFDEFKMQIEQENLMIGGKIDDLIREGHLEAGIATSLMNDAGYARNIVWNLSKIGDALFASQDADTRAVEFLLKLDDDEIMGPEKVSS